VKEADVARARNQLKASLLFMQDSNQRECGDWGLEVFSAGASSA
jgi:hypothetical protein